MNLGETILRLRTGRGMSQEELASALEVSRQSVSKWETNTSTPDLDKLVKLSALFEVTLDELVLGEKKEEPPPEPPISTPPEPPPEPKTSIGSSMQKVIGWLLVCFAAAVWLTLTMITQSIDGIFFALPFLACGVICLTAKRNAGLWCAWAAFACGDLLLRLPSGVTWRLVLLTPVYDASMNYFRLAFAWGELLFMAALMLITVVRFGKHPLEWTTKRRRLFCAGVIAFAILCLPLPQVLLDHFLLYRFVRALADWTQLGLLTALLTSVAQGIFSRSRK